MKYEQILECDLKRMGKSKFRSLYNVRLAFNIGPKFATSNDELKSQIKNKTFHFGLPPKNIATIVFLTPASVYGWCGLWYYGKLYIDGKRRFLKSKKEIWPYTDNILGWGETINGKRIVKEMNDEHI